MLITRPNYEDTTRYLFYWSKLIIDKAKVVKEEVIDLAGKQANLKELQTQINKKNPKFILINGHGNYDLVTGQNSEILVKVGENEEILKKRIVYARSCRSAKKLGKICVEKGTTSYIGYTEDFVFFVSEDNTGNPMDDELARLFLEPANYIAIFLLEGKTTAEANDKSKDMTQQTINQLATSDATKEDRELIPYLRWNLTHQVCLGEKKARI